MSRHRSYLPFSDDLVVNVKLEWTVRFVVLSHPFLSEFDANNVLSGRGCGGGDALFRWDAKEVVAVGDLAVLHE